LFYLALSSWAKSSEGIVELAKSGTDWIVQNASGVFFLLSIMMFVLGISFLLLARGYIKGYEWARRKGRKIAAIALLLAIFGSLFLPGRLDPGSPLWTIMFNLVIIVYLGRARVRAYFKSNK